MKFDLKKLIPGNVTRYKKAERGMSPGQRKKASPSSQGNYSMPKRPSSGRGVGY